MNNDLINRQEAIDILQLDAEMLRRVLDDMDVVGIDREKFSYGLGLIESNIEDIKELPPAQPENKIDGDIISRQQAIEALETVKTVKAENGELYIAKINAQMKLEILPSAQSERKMGHWEGNQPNGRYRCSECGCLSISNDDNFCFNCGADMRGERNETN